MLPSRGVGKASIDGAELDGDAVRDIGPARPGGAARSRWSGGWCGTTGARMGTAWRMEWQGRPHRWQFRGVTFDEAFRRAIGGAAQILSGNGDPK